MLTDTATYLGPATVEEIVGNRILLRLPDREGWAQLALSFPYEPRAGDVVLVIGEEDLFVIGVITGHLIRQIGEPAGQFDGGGVDDLYRLIERKLFGCRAVSQPGPLGPCLFDQSGKSA